MDDFSLAPKSISSSEQICHVRWGEHKGLGPSILSLTSRYWKIFCVYSPVVLDACHGIWLALPVPD